MHFLHSYPDFLSRNLRDVSDVHGKNLYEYIFEK